MIKCSSCGKPIEKVPTWLDTAKVDFVCNNCPNRTTKNIAFVTLEVEPKIGGSDEEEELEIDEDAEV